MKVTVGKKASSNLSTPTKLKPVEETGKILKDGKWQTKPKTSIQSDFIGLGAFEPIKVSGDRIGELLIYLHSENIPYTYSIEKRGNDYYLL